MKRARRRWCAATAFPRGMALAILWGSTLGACASTPKEYSFRVVKEGKHSNYPLVQGRCFKTPLEYRKFAEGVRALGPDCDFPADLPGIDWGREMVIALFAGRSDSSQRVSFLRAGDFAGAVAVFWRRELDVPESVFPDEEAILPEAIEPATPFLVGVLPRSAKPVNFIQSQKLSDGL